jgi:hypothetical protein
MAAPSTQIELVPGEFCAELALRDVLAPGGNIRCRTAITRGLPRVGQAEVSVTLTRTSDDVLDYPRVVLDAFRAIRDGAMQGNTFSEGAMIGGL